MAVGAVQAIALRALDVQHGPADPRIQCKGHAEEGVLHPRPRAQRCGACMARRAASAFVQRGQDVDRLLSSPASVQQDADMTDHAFAFLSNNAFLKAPPIGAATPHAVAGIAWDGSVTNCPGARFAPRTIREASQCSTRSTRISTSRPKAGFGDAGDLPLPNTSLVAMREAMTPQVEKLHPHAPHGGGGDHSITPALAARLPRGWLGRRHGGDPLRRHCDTWEDHFGEPSGHGTWV